MGRVEVETIPQTHHIPAHVIALVHGHYWHIAEKIAVDSRTNIRRYKATADDRKIPISIRWTVFELVHRLRLGGVGLDVVVQIPAIVLVDDEERSHKLAVNVLGSTVRASHTLPRDNNRADQSSVGIVTFEVV